MKIHFSHGTAEVQGEHDVDAFGGIGNVTARGARAGDGEAEKRKREERENPAVESGVTAWDAAEAFERGEGWKSD